MMESASKAVPLSFAQQRLWFIHQLDPDLPVYNIPLALKLTGTVNVPGLQRALCAIVNRHEVLRTVFRSAGGEPTQEVRYDVDLPLPVVEVNRSQPVGSAEAPDLPRLLAEEARRPFDLSSNLPIRACLFKVEEKTHILTVVMHHIAADGWSLGILFRELTVLYNAYAEGGDSPLGQLAVQYADYSVWQRQFLEGSELERLLSYWRKQLADAPTLELPTDKPRPSMQTFGGQSFYVDLSSELTMQLKALAQREGVTLFTALLAAFNVLLSRFADQDDVVVGSPIAGRSIVEVEELIGCFVNTLVFRNDLSGNPSFRQLLRRVHNVALDAYDHQEVPLEKLVEELRPTRDTSRNTLFQVLFALQNTPRAETRLAGLEAERIPISTETAKCDLTVAVLESSDGLGVRFTYNTDLFHPSTISQMAASWQTLLRAIAEDADQPIANLPLLDVQERRKIIVGFNETTTDYPHNIAIQQLFEESVVAHPDAVALSNHDERVTYVDLNQQANQLAHFLMTQGGVTQQSPVAVCLDRGPDFVVTLLAILKCGAIYVPLDPDYPADRLRFMVADSGVSLIVTDCDLPREILGQTVQVVDLHRDRAAISVAESSNPECQVGGADLAYIMYTSGSTGRPKGTAIPHRAIARLVKNTDYVQLDTTDVVAQASNCSFDAATFEIWGALLNGSRLEFVSQQTLVNPRWLASKISSTGMTTLFITTALFNQIVEQAPSTFGKLRHLLFGGEAVTPRFVRRLLEHDPPTRLLHVYGPTETTTFATWHHVTRFPISATTVPIGRPIANTTVYLLDRQGHPVPIGVPGEIHVGGDGVGRGYWNRPELSEQCFVPDPFDVRPESRLYKTGDVARWLSDGSLEFVGRIDSQVKLRGFRIEPSEIEQALLQHPEINSCIVVACENAQTGKQLVAYFVKEPETEPTAGALRGFLRGTLPDYMLPAAFVSMPRMPLTPNGKIDRKALPKPTVHAEARHESFVGPRNKVEVKLASIWAQTMGVERVGRHDDFFELGGHSLLGVRLFARIEKELGISLPLAILFEAPTIGALANLLENNPLPECQQSPLVPIQPRGSKPPFFAIHAAGGHAMFYRKVALEVGEDQPFYAVETVRRRIGELPSRRIDEMATDYIKAIQELQPKGPYYLGGYSAGGNIALEMAQQLIRDGEQVALLAIFDSALLHDWTNTFPIGRQVYGFGHNLVRTIRRPFYDLGYCLCGRLGIRLPVNLETAFLRDSIRIAARAYQPEPYLGTITYFRAQESKPGILKGWKEIARGGLQVYEVKTSHVKMFGIGSGLLSPLLKSCLDEAQAACESDPPDQRSAA